MALFTSSLTTFLCYSTVINFENENLVTNNGPKGNCWLCCPIQEKYDITYLLYRHRYQEKGHRLSHRDPARSALHGGANPELQTIIYLHGFSETVPGFSAVAIRDAYLESGDFNIILVKWGKLVAIPWYNAAVDNTRVMGKNLAKFLQKLDKGGFPLSKVHVIGFSLGAAAAGIAGKLMPTGQRIPRITGLDPAFPLYSLSTPKDRLGATDAEFVDVIHTDAGTFGYPTPLGHVDFYPNGGSRFQPGCRALEVRRTYRSFLLSKYVICSHRRSWKFYAESIGNPYGFPATRCQKWKGTDAECVFRTENYMGILANASAKGQFYLETNSMPPFSKPLQKNSV